MKRKTGQHGKYSVKSPGRAKALIEYRKTVNWSEKTAELWNAPGRREAQSRVATAVNRKWWDNATPEQRAERSKRIRAGIKKKPIPSEAGRRAISKANSKRMAEDPSSYAKVTERSRLAKIVYDKLKARGVSPDWIQLKKISLKDLQEISKRLPD